MPDSKNWKKFATLFSLYIAQSVPMSFFSTVVPVIMRQEHYSLESIGLLQLVKLPWVAKFIWAGWVDNNSRNSKDLKKWIVFSEIFYAAVICSIAFLDLASDFKMIVVLMVVAFTASATQDIATDAFAILVLRKEERAFGNSIQVAGSFVGALISAGILVFAYTYFGWSVFLFMLAGFILFALVPLRFYRKEYTINKSDNYRFTFREFLRFFKIPGMPRHLLILSLFFSGFIGVLTMLKPYLYDLGYNLTQIAFMSGIIGPTSSIVWAFITGFLIRQTGRKQAMMAIAGLITLNAMYFWWIAGLDPSLLQVYLGIFLVWGSYGASSVVIYTSSMDMVRPEASAFDFTFQIVIPHFTSILVAASSGIVADALGYQGLYVGEAVLGLVTLFAVIFAMPKRMVKRPAVEDNNGRNHAAVNHDKSK